MRRRIQEGVENFIKGLGSRKKTTRFELHSEQDLAVELIMDSLIGSYFYQLRHGTEATNMALPALLDYCERNPLDIHAYLRSDNPSVEFKLHLIELIMGPDGKVLTDAPNMLEEVYYLFSLMQTQGSLSFPQAERVMDALSKHFNLEEDDDAESDEEEDALR